MWITLHWYRFRRVRDHVQGLIPDSSPGTMQLQAVQANIVTLQFDAIVNAANSSLLGGGGVDGAIHKAAGPDLLRECRLLGGCKPGDAKITGGYRLPARHVIHTVGPIWAGGAQGEAEVLASCYRRSLELAAQHNLRTIAFPSISTGVYGYPIKRAASIAVRTVSGFRQHGAALEGVVFCCFSMDDLVVYQDALAQVVA